MVDFYDENTDKILPCLDGVEEEYYIRGDISVLNSLGIYVIRNEIPTFNRDSHRIEFADVVKEGNEYVRKFSIVKLNPKFAASRIRIRRDNLLRQSDVKALTDYPHVSEDMKNRWFKYRQALRDLTEQEEFPFNVKWPTEPDK